MISTSELQRALDRLRRKMENLADSNLYLSADMLGDLALALGQIGIYSMEIAEASREACNVPSAEARIIASAVLAQATLTTASRRAVIDCAPKAQPQFSEG